VKNPGAAAVLSFVVPGLGQIYNGHFLWALFWLIVTPGFWLGSGGTLGFVCHFASAYFAHQAAREEPYRLPSSLPRR
jgi:TM2 domain-containing membrane protein YozV